MIFPIGGDRRCFYAAGKGAVSPAALARGGGGEGRCGEQSVAVGETSFGGGRGEVG